MATLLAPVPAVTFANRYAGARGVVMHEHAGIELVLVLRGRCRIRVGDATLAAGAGELFVLPAGVPHDQADEGEVETLYVEFTAPARHFSDRPRTLPVPLGSWAATWIRQLVALDREPVPPTVRSGLALALIAHLDHLERRDESHRALPPGVATALRTMEADVRVELTVDDLARAAGLSASHLAALFRRHLGCAPMAWRQRQRLDLALRLLRNALHVGGGGRGRLRLRGRPTTSRGSSGSATAAPRAPGAAAGSEYLPNTHKSLVDPGTWINQAAICVICEICGFFSKESPQISQMTQI